MGTVTIADREKQKALNLANLSSSSISHQIDQNGINNNHHHQSSSSLIGKKLVCANIKQLLVDGISSDKKAYEGWPIIIINT